MNFDGSALDGPTLGTIHAIVSVILQLIILPLVLFAVQIYRRGQAATGEIRRLTTVNGTELEVARTEISALFKHQDETHRELRDRLTLDVGAKIEHLTQAMERLGGKIDTHLQWHSERGSRVK